MDVSFLGRDIKEQDTSGFLIKLTNFTYWPFSFDIDNSAAILSFDVYLYSYYLNCLHLNDNKIS